MIVLASCDLVGACLPIMCQIFKLGVLTIGERCMCIEYGHGRHTPLIRYSIDGVTLTGLYL